MPEPNRQLWFAVRSVYLFGKKKNGKNIFEERVVAFSAANSDEALTKGDAESSRYASDLNLQVHCQQVCFEQDGDPLIDGYEVWSQLFESDDDLETFFQKRYGNFDYKPD